MPATDVRKGLLGNGCVQKDCLSSSSLVDSRNELLTFGYDAHKTRGKSRMCATYLTVRNPSNPVLLLRRQPPTSAAGWTRPRCMPQRSLKSKLSWPQVNLVTPTSKICWFSLRTLLSRIQHKKERKEKELDRSWSAQTTVPEALLSRLATKKERFFLLCVCHSLSMRVCVCVSERV